ncbi:MAG: zinc ribbon domain-containing protein [Chloroflexota bacterium]
MPRYDYQCDTCGHMFEARHGFDDPAPACPACEAETVSKRITSAPTFARGVLTPAGTSRRQSKEELRDKWREETPKLRKKLEKKLGKDTVRQNAPSLYNNYD